MLNNYHALFVQVVAVKFTSVQSAFVQLLVHLQAVYSYNSDVCAYTSAVYASA
jgi:hypothetical protein